MKTIAEVEPAESISALFVTDKSECNSLPVQSDVGRLIKMQRGYGKYLRVQTVPTSR
ncbi:hypothetical protein KIN20_011825 [Parelaphostrongylus tenuis]|uniref:Uncharacterized protein n=1 Tax=Parelaphostrongylus tenuis TaxID=148309 RepID=A0AAD5MDJ1_PARTN|nr:hypothetical protein KIN20_011825 [Parelaphostrongylus tenuis]